LRFDPQCEMMVRRSAISLFKARNRMRFFFPIFPAALLLLVTACDRKVDCPTCGTVVVAAVGEPASIFPPLVHETVGRDIGDLVYERLADLTPRRATIDEGAYTPALASKWERVDSLTWRFTLREGARWHDGRPVSPQDVVYSFQVFQDSTIDAAPRAQLSPIAAIEPADSNTVLVRFTHAYSEQLYDATYHVRIIPRHVWEGAGDRSTWPEDTTTSRLIGSGPYRFSTWQRGQALTLVADTSRPVQPAIRRVVWRFAGDPEAAANLAMSHEVDLLETAGIAGAEQLAKDTAFRLLPFPSASYGLIGFRISGTRARPSDGILSSRDLRRALIQSVDRATVARAVFGVETKVPPGPISQLLWIWDTNVKPLPFDTAAAGAAFDAAGWRRGPDGMRSRAGRPLRIEILVPSTSTPRRRAAEAVQAQWKAVGVDGAVTLADFPVMQERIGQGNFDAFVGAWLDEPSPRGLADQWARSGWDNLNYGRYYNPVVDSLLSSAGRTTDAAEAGRLYRAVLDTLNADAPAMFLFAPTSIAAVSRRLDQVSINPYSWLSGLPQWQLRDGAR
jgi:peptide/nickel transport system substrate-binding protein